MVWALHDEAVLRRPAGGTEVMAERVEHIIALTAVPVRDSKDPAGPALLIPTAGWSAFVDAVRDGSQPGWIPQAGAGPGGLSVM